MSYLIAVVITCVIIWIRSRNDFMIRSNKGIIYFMSIILTLLITAIINILLGIACIYNCPTTTTVEEVEVCTNEITNEYYIINSQGKIITNDEKDIAYEIDGEVNKTTGQEITRTMNFGIWLVPMTQTDYKILIPFPQ